MEHLNLDDLARDAKAGKTDIIERAHGQTVASAQRILDRAENENRDLTTGEHADWQELKTRMQTTGDLIKVARRNRDTIERSHTEHRATFSSTGSAEWREAITGRTTGLDIDLAGAYLAQRGDRRGHLERRDLTTSIATVPTEILNELVLRLTQASGVLAASPRLIMTERSGNTIKVPTVTAYGTANLVSEGSAFAESDPTTATVDMGAYKIGRLLQVTDELIADTSFDIERYLATELGTSVGTKISSLLASTNAGTTQPQGIMGTATTTGVTGGTGVAGAPTVANIITLYHSVPSQYRGSSMGWVMHSDTMNYLAGLVDTTNRPLLLPSLSGDAPTTLLGKPVYIDNQVAAFATGVASIWVGDMSSFYAVRMAGALRLEVSRDFAFDEGKVTYRVDQRLDGRIINADAARKFVGGAS